MSDLSTDPVDQSAEASVLTAVLTDPEFLAELNGRLKASDFAYRPYADIFAAAATCEATGKPCDKVSIASELDRAGVYGKTVSPELVDTLMEPTTESVNALTHVEVVLDRSKKRRVMRAVREIASTVAQPDVTGDMSITVAEREIAAVEDTITTSTGISLGDSLAQSLQRIRERDPEELVGIPTGFPRLDELTQGLQGSKVVIIAGRPASGKTSLAMQLLAKAAEETGDPVLILSHEMSHEELSTRLLATYLGLSLRDLSTGHLLATREEDVLRMAERISNLPIEIVDNPPKTGPGMCALLRRYHRRRPLAAAGVDFIQLMHGQRRTNQTRAEELGEIITSSKDISKELDIPMLVLAQLNRGLETRMDKRPQNSDLKESGDLEQAADLIMMLHRPAMYDPNADPSQAELHLTKQRNGPTDVIPLRWNGACTRYENPKPGAAASQAGYRPPVAAVAGY